jgi:hypothetical protein
MSEVPLTYLTRLVERHGGFGVGLTKADVRECGGQRVWYVDEGTDVMATLDALLDDVTRNTRWDDGLWKLTRLIDRVTPDGQGRPRYEFEWEREWRVPGDMSIANVPFLFIPESWHAGTQEELGPLRLIDPRWDERQIEHALL